MNLLCGARRLASVLAAALILTTSARAEPAMWLIQDKDSRIYLFGTIHILPPETQWRSPKIDAAIADAAELWLEIPNISSAGVQVAAAIAVLSQGFSFSKPLTARLTKEQLASLEKAARAQGFSLKELNAMRPWLVALLLQTGGSTGTNVVPGVDVQVEKGFHKRNLPVKGFETVGQQISIFSKLPEKDELAMLLDTVAAADTSGEDFDDLLAIWQSGDTDAMEKLIVADMKSSSPVLYDALLRNRNIAWADQIETLLKGKGDIFIAVGAAHLSGPDSVQALLRAKGIDAVRK